MSTDEKLVILTDSPSLQSSPVKLDGPNYLAWSRSCLLFVKARGLQEYLIGKSSKPKITDSTFSQWDSTNSLVMAWLINSMQPHISKTYLLLDIAKKIWNAATLTYSRVGNDAQIFEIRNKVHGTKQGELTISQYFAELSGLWQKLGCYQDFQANCAKDAEKFQKIIKKERVFYFLAGLNTEYDQIRVQVLGKTLFSSLHMAYSYVQ
ncbi:ankyrin repeat domain-containing protein 2b [Gossypium australe]|uniref:Ankyrin repeat domain-containing protein 2b n=1 Tax=Gossypium australe TaxID=47621 RepID=A0A5B6W5P6_9ROSI|nr:ankyrin repeat domain-containing protein 2b [Gossypium australe]